MNFSEQLEFLKQLENVISTKVREQVEAQVKDPYQSSETKDIDAAFAKAQLEYPKIQPNRKNKFHLGPYSDLDNIMLVIRPILAKYGLGFSQFTKIDEHGARILHSRLRHSSGQWFESRERVIPDRNDDHTYASCLQDKKRHQAIALLNITVVDDATDDDAEISMQESRRRFIKGTALNKDYDPKEEESLTITPHEYEELTYELGEHADILDKLLTDLKIQSLIDMPRSKYRMSLETIRTIKEARRTGTIKRKM